MVILLVEMGLVLSVSRASVLTAKFPWSNRRRMMQKRRKKEKQRRRVLG